MLRLALLLLTLPSVVLSEEDFETRVLNAIMQNPEVVLLALESLEKQNETRKQVERIDGHHDTLFPSNEIRLVEFVDYRCSFCALNAEIVAEMAKEYPASIRTIELPILGAASVEIAKVALAVKAVAGEAAYKQFHNAVFEAEGRIFGRVPALNLAEDLGYDKAAIAETSVSNVVEVELNQNLALARGLSLTGTPAFVWREGILEGLMEVDQMRTILSN